MKYQTKRISPLVCFLVVLAAVAGCAPAPARLPAAEPRPPNIVVVLVDDLRWDDLGIEGRGGSGFLDTGISGFLARHRRNRRNEVHEEAQT